MDRNKTKCEGCGDVLDFLDDKQKFYTSSDGYYFCDTCWRELIADLDWIEGEESVSNIQ